FDLAASSKESKLLDGASVLIEANTRLRSNLPPGANDLVKAIRVTK
ncbi:MAG: hypothetical protein RL023_415, partial [Candidatus Parcubacteria bacterium]